MPLDLGQLVGPFSASWLVILWKWTSNCWVWTVSAKIVQNLYERWRMVHYFMGTLSEDLLAITHAECPMSKLCTIVIVKCEHLNGNRIGVQTNVCHCVTGLWGSQLRFWISESLFSLLRIFSTSRYQWMANRSNILWNTLYSYPCPFTRQHFESELLLPIGWVTQTCPPLIA